MANLDLSWAVRSVDSLLRVRQGIEEFTDDPECLLRISVISAPQSVDLSDGISIDQGEPVLQLHFWNEHLPVLPPDGPTPAWANLVKRRMRRSFATVADHLEGEPRLDNIRAIQGAPAFPSRLGPHQLARVAGHFGFDVIGPDGSHKLARQVHDVFDSLLLWGLIRTFNPVGLRGKGLLRHRCQVWISRRKLLNHYGGSGHARDLS